MKSEDRECLAAFPERKDSMRSYEMSLRKKVTAAALTAVISIAPAASRIICAIGIGAGIVRGAIC